jgi:hypothetical protein
MNEHLLETLGLIMQWIIAPVAAFVALIYMRQQEHSTDIAVLKAEAKSQKEAHESEIIEIRANMRAIILKLDSIEMALRK